MATFVSFVPPGNPTIGCLILREKQYYSGIRQAAGYLEVIGICSWFKFVLYLLLLGGRCYAPCTSKRRSSFIAYVGKYTASKCLLIYPRRNILERYCNPGSKWHKSITHDFYSHVLPLLYPLFPSLFSLLHPTIEFKPLVCIRIIPGLCNPRFSGLNSLHLHAFTPPSSRGHALKSRISFSHVYATLYKFQLAAFFSVKSSIRLH
jgi:hypothetical protein